MSRAEFTDHDWPGRAARGWALVCGLVALFLIALVASAGCAHLPHVDAEPRDKWAEDRAAVLVLISCTESSPFGDDDAFQNFDLSMRRGTGVVIDERHVLTAYHVAHCPFGQTARGVLSTGRRVMLQVDKEDEALDLARLTIATQDNFKLYVPPPVVGRVAAGDTVCSAVASPHRGWSCGQVESSVPGYKGIRGWWESVPGNSGAGLYKDGALVGIVTHEVFCSKPVPGQPPPLGCGALATPLAGVHADWFAP